MNDIDNLSGTPQESLPEKESMEKTSDVSSEVNNEKQDECIEACAIEESPSLDLAQAADSIEEQRKEEEKNTIKSFHSMNKQELVDALKNTVESGDLEKHKEIAAIKQAYYALINAEREKELEEFIAAGNEPSTFSFTPDPQEEEVKKLLAEFKEKRNKYLEEKEELRKKNLEEKNRIIEELKNISEDIDNINQQFPKFQQLQQDFKAAGEVPPGSENELWKNYQSAVEQFYDRLKMNKELRDLDFKKNLEIKNALVEKAVSLADLPDPIEAFRILQTLHEQWRETGPVAREIREEIWNKFKDASTVVNKRHQDYFQTRRAEEQANETAKAQLCEKAEALDIESFNTFAEWDNATKEILALQAAWKELGFASRKMNNALFTRFREACDKFFSAKAEFFKKIKEESKENLAKKEALCEKAEALVEEFERKGALEEIQALQKEWKNIGVVRRKQGDEIWKRFCGALDKFYEARKKLFSGKKEEEVANLAAKREIIEKLKAISEEEERKDVIENIRELQNEWQGIGHVPFKDKDEVNNAYRKELDRLFGAFDIRESRQRVRRFENEVRKIAGEEGKLSKERDKLNRALEGRINEMKTIENNMGFFNVKSSAGNSMLKEMERKISRIKEEIEEIKQKISLLDNQEKA